MFLPTMSGQWSLDNDNIPETDTTLGVHTGDLPLSRLIFLRISTERFDMSRASRAQ